jgi:serine protease
MKNPGIKRWIFLFLLPLGAIAGTAWMWHGGLTQTRAAKSGAAAGDVADQAQTMLETGNHALIVDYRDDVTDADLEATPEVEQPISRWSSVDRIYRVRFDSTQTAARAALRLVHSPRVESVEWDVEAAIPPDEEAQEAAAYGDRSMQAECGSTAGADNPGFPSDPCYRYQWHLRQVGLPEAWKLGQGAGVVVAVIDTGVSRVPDLAETTFVPGYNFVADNDNAADDHGHGTHVAGTIAQTTHNKLGVGGVAFKASIMPLKVLSARGSGSMAAIAQAIRYAADHGAQVINMSLGGPFPVATIGSAVKYAHGKGVTVVAAAGNDGRGKVGYPARYPGVIAVAATQFDETTTFYSNWGPEVDIAAPGGNVRVDQNGDGKPDGVLQNTIVPGDTSRTDYMWFMGTSMASPHVAGVAALIIGAGVTKPQAVEQVLLETARPPKSGSESGPKSGSTAGTQGRIDDRYGAGLVDARAALSKIRTGRGTGELGLAGMIALLGLSFLSRNGRRIGKLGWGFPLALVVGSCGLFALRFLPSPLGQNADALGPISLGTLNAIDAWLPSALRGSPVVWSALVPVAVIGLFYGISRMRGALAGFGFGIAGALLFAAISSTFDVRIIPDFLDRPWLVSNAALSALLATAVLRR